MAQSNPYVSQSASGYNASPPPDDGSQSAANQVAWSKHKTKLADPIKTLSDGINSAANTAFGTIVNRMEGLIENNLIKNPGFAVAQMGTSFTAATTPANNDDTYTLDQWIILSDGNDTVDVTRVTTPVPTGARYAIGLDVETGNRKFGIFQPIEAVDSARIVGGTASLQFKARISGTSLTKLRAAVMAWSSTADTLTSDVVSAWNVQGTNPTLVANWTYENTAVDLTTPTTSYQTYTIEGISIDTASAANVGVFIWIENTTTTVGDFLYIADVQLQPGSVATAYEPRPFAQELVLCQRYLEKSYQLASAPGTVEGLGNMQFVDPIAQGSLGITYQVLKRLQSCTMTIYSPATGASAVFRDLTSAADVAASTANRSEHGFTFECAASHGAADESLSFHWVADARL